MHDVRRDGLRVAREVPPLSHPLRGGPLAQEGNRHARVGLDAARTRSGGVSGDRQGFKSGLQRVKVFFTARRRDYELFVTNVIPNRSASSRKDVYQRMMSVFYSLASCFLVASLGDSIRDLNSAAVGMGGSAGASQKYSDQMAQAAAQMESINSLYTAQLESASRQAEINQDTIENATKLKEQMESLASNLSSLNGVYGGMLSAMNNK